MDGEIEKILFNLVNFIDRFKLLNDKPLPKAVCDAIAPVSKHINLPVLRDNILQSLSITLFTHLMTGVITSHLRRT